MKRIMRVIGSAFVLLGASACASAGPDSEEAYEAPDEMDAGPAGEPRISGGGNNGPTYGKGGIPNPEEVCWDCPAPERGIDSRIRPPYREQAVADDSR